ncbi:hypothetical protein GCM10022198_04290 [Klugiella xanthotipulae]|uniref:Putative membrane protein (TIGR02234 family) n=1 Tax=Klugiella xanthotipulae TaxID=244735 RepID=A0A543HSJ6_9MICO|nr:Trp biosynthesis-associated membrane protein [Klugiella xanthotipulae]TQM61313.1 putative membrane protein (TIGR02234 family) [Klugiella xanthotipulae]
MTRERVPSPQLKRYAILGVLVASGLVFLAWSQPWFTLTLRDAAGVDDPIQISGQQAAASLSAFALCGLALGGALSISGLVFRYVLGVLQILLGICILVATTAALGDPTSGAGAVITEQTGLAGSESLRTLVESVAVSVWPWLGCVVAGLVVLSGMGVLVTSARWPRSSSRYQTVVIEASGPGVDVDASEPEDRISEWDRMSRGVDPTEN